MSSARTDSPVGARTRTCRARARSAGAAPRAASRSRAGSARASASRRWLVGVRRVRRVVDQQHDADVRVLLQRGREQRLADDAALLAVGGDDRRERRVRLVEERVDDGARDTAVRAGPLQVAEPGDEVGDRRERSGARRAAGRRRPRSCLARRTDGRRTAAPARRSTRARRRRQEECEARAAHRAARRDGCMIGAAPDVASVPHCRRIRFGSCRVGVGVRMRILMKLPRLECEPWGSRVRGRPITGIGRVRYS